VEEYADVSLISLPDTQEDTMTPRKAPTSRVSPAKPPRLSGAPAPFKLATGLRGILLFTRYTRRNITLDLPLNQIAVLVAVFGKGEAGETLAGIGEILGGMSQSSVSKNVRALSRFMVPGTDRVVGHDLLRSEPDLVNRKRMRVFLTAKGKELINTLAACLTGEFTDRQDLPGFGPGEGETL
jgi:DNA-binding MarR family transcriptional regulator